MWALAWRNVWRHKTRSLVAGGAVAVVVACTLVFFGFVEATKTGMFAVLTSDSGHLQVTSSRAEGAPDFYSRLIRDAAQVEAALLHWKCPLSSAVKRGPAGRWLWGWPMMTPWASGLPGSIWLPDVCRLRAAGMRSPWAKPWRGRCRWSLGTRSTFSHPARKAGARPPTLVGLLDFPQTSYEIQVAYLSLEGAQVLAAPGAVTRLELHLSPGRGVPTDALIEDTKARAAAVLGPDVRVETWRDIMDP